MDVREARRRWLAQRWLWQTLEVRWGDEGWLGQQVYHFVHQGA